MASSSGNSGSVRDESAIKKMSFNDPSFLSFFGLTSTNILEYFYLSPFYDPNCDNQGLRMQGASLENLKNMKGIQYEYVPSEHEPKMFKVKRVRRDGPDLTTTLEVYYCLEGTFYQSPDLFEIATTRGQKITAYMRESLRATEEASFFSSADGQTCFRERADDTELLEEFDFRGFPPVTALLSDVAAVAGVFKPAGEATATSELPSRGAL